MEAMNDATVDSAVAIQLLSSRREFEEASSLYQRVFGYDDRFTLNSKVMRALSYAGGVALGARTESGELVGFVYGFPALDDGVNYLFSQAACVAEASRGHGIGQALKRQQRSESVARGLTKVRWAFDPLNTRNGFINLDLLGSRGRWYRPDFYDDGASDRLIVEWDAAVSADAAATDVDWASVDTARVGVAQQVGNSQIVIVFPPAESAPSFARTKAMRAIRVSVEAGFAVISCPRIAPRVHAYVLTRNQP